MSVAGGGSWKAGRQRLQAELMASDIISACLYFRTQGVICRALSARRKAEIICRALSVGRLQEDEAERRAEIEDGICRASAERRSGTQGGNRERRAETRKEGKAEDGSPAECDPEDESSVEGEASSGRQIVGAEQISTSDTTRWRQGGVAGRRKSASRGDVSRRCSRAASQGQAAQDGASKGRSPASEAGRQGGVAGRASRAASQGQAARQISSLRML